MLDVPVDFHAKDFELDQPDLEKVTDSFQRVRVSKFTRKLLLELLR